VLEKKPLLPSHIKALIKKLEDYGFAGFEVSGLSGTVEKAGEKLFLTARGSNQKYEVSASEELKKLVAAGKSGVILGGRIKQADEKATPILEVTEAKESAK
jgi:hypothetical protein